MAVPLLAAALNPGPPEARVLRAQYRMGTVLEIDAVGAYLARTEEAVANAFAAVGSVETRLSNWKPDSELSRANRRAARAPVALSPATFRSLSAAFDLAAESEGAFDPTVGAVTEGLELTGGPVAPERAAAGAAAVGYRFARLEPAGRTLAFERPGVSIDSGAFGKGEALDRAAAALRRGGVEAARLNFGGQILVFGTATPAGRRHRYRRLAVAAPDLSGRIARGIVAGDGSLSTSGEAEKPGHLIDPRTGRAAAFHGSASVVADTALRADALSTALFVLGPEEGVAFADRRGIAALFLSSRAGEPPRTSRAWRAFPSWTASEAREGRGRTR
ncbi:MAG: FAD:protein FMN transferase [Acidobacteriota bacterium]|nr:FAD:protein FMN transferase [Acidobacteriota bacterium]